jgi:Zn-dependent protease/CBS domain-containing protein
LRKINQQLISLPKLVTKQRPKMFANARKILTVNGFDIKLDPSWLIIASLITWSLSQQYFPYEFPGATSTAYLAMAVIAMLCFFASLLLHELAHSVVARRLGVPIKSITLFMFGGVAELEAEPTSAPVEFWIALAGPLMSLSLAFGFWMLAQIASMVTDVTPVTLVLSYLALVNIVLALFNLVPAFPLDGGRMLRAYLWDRSGNVLNATKTAANAGATFAFILMGLGLLALFQGALVTGLWQLLIGGFVLTAARSSYQSQLAHKVFDGKFVRDLMKPDPITIGPDMTLSEFVNLIMLQHGVSFVPVIESGILLGHMDQAILSGIDRENWGSTQVGDVFAKSDNQSTLAPDLPVQDLLALISKTGQRKFLVTKGQTLLGVISLADLTH